MQEGGVVDGDVLILGGKVAAIGSGLTRPDGCAVLNAIDHLVFPGLLDPQVHFREPGLMYKEDLSSGSLAAIAGGVIGFLDMPNTEPPTISPQALQDKMRRASGNSWADYGFFLGATAGNAERLGEWEDEPGCCGIKVFMGSSTGAARGPLLVPDDPTLLRVLRSGRRRVAVHAEDETRLRERYAGIQSGSDVAIHPAVRDVETALRATTRLLDLAEKSGRRVHLLHVSTAEEVALLRERDLDDLVTAEVTPNHLHLEAPDCYEKHGAMAQMNPPVRERRHRDALRQALVEGVLDCIGSDHAPHTLEEKQRPYPASPSGIPGVQTTLPLLLTAVRDGWLALEDIVRVTARRPAEIWSIEGKGDLRVGNDGDLVVVDPAISQPLPLSWLRSRAGWSPYIGRALAGWPVTTVLRGRIIHDRHVTCGEPAGEPMQFG